MKDQLETIRVKHQINMAREFVENVPHDTSCALRHHADNFCDCGKQEALTALSELERMAGESVACVTVEQLSKMAESLEGLDKGQPGYHWRKGWNDALRRAMDYAAPPAQQPQAETALGMYGHRCPSVTGHRGPSFVCQKAGHAVGQHSYCNDCVAAPQQAEAVPSDVMRDAERYRWLRGNQLLAKVHYMPRPTAESLDHAIDAAMAQGEKK